jgi:cell division protein FtsL
MNRLTFFLLAALVLCALALVNAQHEARSLFVMMERAQNEERQLNIDWSRLQYEQSALGKSARIAEAARMQLKMSPVSPGRTQYISGPTLAKPLAPIPASAPAAEAQP